METNLNRRQLLSGLAVTSIGLLAGCSDTGLGGTEYISSIENDGMTLIVSLENEEDISQVVVDTPTESAIERTSINAGVDHVEFDIWEDGIFGGRDPERGEYTFTAYNQEKEELDSRIYEYNPELAVTAVDMRWTQGESQYGATIDLLGIEFTIKNTSDVPIYIDEFYYDDIDDMTSISTTDYPYVTTGSFEVETEASGNQNVLNPNEERQYVAPEFLTTRYRGIPSNVDDCGYEMRGVLAIRYADDAAEQSLDFNLGGQKVTPSGTSIAYCGGTEITSGPE